MTKMASLHFATHEAARRRILQLGEPPERVFCFGATAVDQLFKTPFLSREALERDLGISLEGLVLLTTFHPLTMDRGSAEVQLQALLAALDALRRDRPCSVVFTAANADNGGRALNQTVKAYVSRHPNCYWFDSLGRSRYLSLMKEADAVIGNSSSGIYEAPYVQTASVDIGSRQQGRAAPKSVIRCEPDARSILDAVSTAVDVDFADVDMIAGGAE